MARSMAGKSKRTAQIQRMPYRFCNSLGDEADPCHRPPGRMKSPASPPTLLTPRPHQVAARDAILRARRGGRPGSCSATSRGSARRSRPGAALAAMPEADVLIVCPKGAMPQWRRTIARSGLAAKARDADQLRAHQVADGAAGRQHATIDPGEEQRARQARGPEAGLAAGGVRREPPPAQPLRPAEPGLPPTRGCGVASRST